jgi:hypothetical protein
VARTAAPLVLAAGFLVGVAGGSPVNAEPTPAATVAPSDSAAAALSKAREAGERARAGDYAGAVRLFKQAHGLDARPEYACNVGIAYYKARDLPRAHYFLDGCLAAGADLPADFLASVRRVFATVEERLEAGDFAPVELRVSPAHARIIVSSFASDEPIATGRRIWLPVGQHLLLATALRHETRQIAVDLLNRDPRGIDMVLEPFPGQAPANPAPAPAPAPSAAPAPRLATPSRVAMPPRVSSARLVRPAPLASIVDPGSARRVAPSRGAAVGLTVGATISFAVSTLFILAADEAESPDDPYDVDADAAMYRTLGITGYVATAGLGVAALILWGKASSQQKAMVGASAGGGNTSLWLGGRF